MTRPGWNDDTLWQHFTAHAAADPQALAVVDREGSRRHSRGQLLADSVAFATALERDGLVPGDVLSVQLPNRYETAVVALAALRLGLVINTLLPNYRERELDHIFSTATPRAVVTPAVHRRFDHRPMIDSLQGGGAGRFSHVVVDGDEFLDQLRADPQDASAITAPEPGASAWSELIFSSGTESTPKGVLHSEQTTNAGVRSFREFLGLDDDAVVWMPSPVGHSTGFNFGLRFALFHGFPLILQDEWDPAIAISLVRRFGASYTLAATTFLQDLVRVLGDRNEQLPELTSFACGGAAVPPELVTAARRRGIGVQRLYGSTEALVVSCNRPDRPEAARLHTDGVALPGVAIRIRGDDGELLEPGAPGEIEVQSPQNALGYYDDPERTAATFLDDNWVRSGDLGVLDDDGSLSIVGRKKEIIIRGGLNIAPREIEEMLLDFAEVERCAVVGLADPRLGERMAAFVTLVDGAQLTLATAVERLREKGLATYKLPELLEVLDELPATASGKIQKHRLRRDFDA
ncbi:MAG: AMP-binding protein [Acidimicrobiales bacterium]